MALLHVTPKITRKETNTEWLEINFFYDVWWHRDVENLVYSWSCDPSGNDTVTGSSPGTGWNCIYHGWSMQDAKYGVYEEHWQKKSAWVADPPVTTP